MLKNKAGSLICREMFLQTNLIAQTEARVDLAWCKVLLLSGGGNEVETETPAEKVFNLQGVRHYILSLSLADIRHEGKKKIWNRGKVHSGAFDVCVGKALQCSLEFSIKTAEVSGLEINEARSLQRVGSAAYAKIPIHFIVHLWRATHDNTQTGTHTHVCTHRHACTHAHTHTHTWELLYSMFYTFIR